MENCPLVRPVARTSGRVEGITPGCWEQFLAWCLYHRFGEGNVGCTGRVSPYMPCPGPAGTYSLRASDGLGFFFCKIIQDIEFLTSGAVNKMCWPHLRRCAAMVGLKTQVGGRNTLVKRVDELWKKRFQFGEMITEIFLNFSLLFLSLRANDKLFFFSYITLFKPTVFSFRVVHFLLLSVMAPFIFAFISIRLRV